MEDTEKFLEITSTFGNDVEGSPKSSSGSSNRDNKFKVTDEPRPTTPRTDLDSHTHVNPPDVEPSFGTNYPKADGAIQNTQHSPPTQDPTTQDTTAKRPKGLIHFRAVIVGGGPTGLCLAHALHLAGIDYVLLERGSEVVVQDGAGLALWPHSVRILDQLGLLDEARRHFFPIRTKHNHRPDGSVRDVNDMFARMEVKHGHPWMLFHRAKLLGLLWASLLEKETRVKVGKEVGRIVSYIDGMVVYCTDGTFEVGSIVIGCDGVHSFVRDAIHEMESQMRSSAGRLSLTGLARLARLGRDPGGERKKPTRASYHGLIGWIPLPDGLQQGACYEVRSEPRGRTFHILTGEDTAYCLVYVRLARPTRQRSRYTDEDAEGLAASLAGHRITPGLTFGDLWRARKWARMVDYEEGILGGRWYHERAVLVGDAVHKLTPNAGLGLNTGWQGVAELTNRLRRLVVGVGHRNPDTSSVEWVCRKYQKSHKAMARATVLVSSLYTRVVASQSPLYRFFDRVTPAIGGGTLCCWTGWPRLSSGGACYLTLWGRGAIERAGSNGCILNPSPPRMVLVRTVYPKWVRIVHKMSHLIRNTSMVEE